MKVKSEKAKVVEVHQHSSDEPETPVLVKFQNGQMTAISKNNTHFHRVMHKKNGKVSKAAVVEASGQIYHGVFKDSEEELTDNYICVRNKITNTVRIIPIEEVTVNNDVYNQLEKVRLKNIAEDISKKKLLQQFGGRKAARYIANQENNRLDVSTLETELDTTVKETTLDENDGVPTEAALQHYDRIRPKFNSEATTLNDVYDIYDVVPLELLDRLENEAQSVLNTDLDMLPISSEYLLSCIKKIQTAIPSAQGLLHIKLIIYMDCLLNVIEMRQKTLSGEISKITEKVETDVRARFSDDNRKHGLTLYTKEKAICYFIVLALIISESYQVNINILTKELRSAKVRVIKYAKIVNAKLQKNSDILELHLPSKLPKLPLREGRKRSAK